MIMLKDLTVIIIEFIGGRVLYNGDLNNIPEGILNRGIEWINSENDKNKITVAVI